MANLYVNGIFGCNGLNDNTKQTINGLPDVKYSQRLANTSTSVQIPGGADLNSTDYLKAGHYYCNSQPDVRSLANCPTRYEFMMSVTYVNSQDNRLGKELTLPWVYLVQKILDFHGDEWIRSVKSQSTGGEFIYGNWRPTGGLDSRYFYNIDITHDNVTTLTSGARIPVKFADGSTTFNFKSSGRPLLINGGVVVNPSAGGNVYFGFRVDGVDYGYYTTSKGGYFGLSYVLSNLTAGDHTFQLMGWVNVSSFSVSSAARTNIMLVEI